MNGYTFRGRKQPCHYHFCLSSQWGQLLKERIFSFRSRFFLLRVDLFFLGGGGGGGLNCLGK